MENQKNNTCILVQELLPVYIDECISESCKIAVDEHIKQCDTCLGKLEELKNDINKFDVKAIEQTHEEFKEKQNFSKLSKLLKHRRIRNVIITVGMVCILFITYTVCFKSMLVGSNSMSPTIETGENCVIFRYSYLFAVPKREDIIVAEKNGNLKLVRVVGISGDVIEIKNGSLYVNGEENSFYRGITTLSDKDTYSIIVPQNSYFVLGDNFNNSLDSRDESFGCVNIDDIYGKCIFHGDIFRNPFIKTSSVTESIDVE